MSRDCPLIVFDIDGTLTESVSVHVTAFVASLERFGFTRINTDWGSYKHISDSYIFHAQMEAHEDREPSDAERERFESIFDATYVETVGDRRTTSTPGASALLGRLDRAGIPFCFATGSFRSAAEAKLGVFAGVECLPVLATASEALSRQEIVGLAIAKACAKHGVASFGRILSIGDGLWDLRTAVSLGLDFVGVAHGAHRERLVAEGAKDVVESFADSAWLAYEKSRFGSLAG